MKRTWLIALSLLAVLTAGVAQPAQARSAQQSPNFAGVWISNQCEVRPGGPFAKRRLLLINNTFSMSLTAYNDGKCTIPSLTMRVEGTFSLLGDSYVAPGVYPINLLWKQVFLRPEVNQTAEFLNSSWPGLCGSLGWSVGGEQDVTGTQGCRLLAIDLRRPISEFDIVGVSGNFLYMGLRPGDGGQIYSPDRRPSVFSVPLVKFQDVPDPIFAPGTTLPPFLPNTGGDNVEG